MFLVYGTVLGNFFWLFLTRRLISLLQSALSKYDATKQKRKFSSFFKSLVIELDKDLYGPDNHLVEVSSSVL